MEYHPLFHTNWRGIMSDKQNVVVHIGPTRCYINYGQCSGHWKYFLEGDLNNFVRSKLTTWKMDPVSKKYSIEAIYSIHDIANEIIWFPSAFCEKLIMFLNSKDYIVSRTPIECAHTRSTTFTRNPGVGPRDDMQRRAVEYLRINAGTRCGLEIQTGGGKTGCTLLTCEQLKHPTLIIVEGLLEQWVQEVHKFLDIAEDKVYVIQGNQSIKDLFESDLKPDIFIASLATLRSYVKNEELYTTLPTYSEFIQHYGIGIKVIDEAHKNLHATSLIDMCGDVATNYYLTATFIGTKSARGIFEIYFPNQIRYSEDYEQYCEVIGYSYYSRIPPRSTMMFGMYNHARVEKMMLKNKERLYNVYLHRILIPIIARHYMDKQYPGKKLLIYFTLKKFIKQIAKDLQKVYPELKVVTYLDKDPRSNLLEGDLIVSTHKGAGTGTDIPNLVTIINTVSVAAESTIRQILGRLRKLKDGCTPTFVDIHDYGNFNNVRHWRTRGTILRNCAKSFRELKL